MAKVKQQHIVVLCDFCLWGADDVPVASAASAVEWINARVKEGHYVTLVSRRLNYDGKYASFLRDVTGLGLDYTELHATNGFPRADAVYVGGGKGIKEPT